MDWRELGIPSVELTSMCGVLVITSVFRFRFVLTQHKQAYPGRLAGDRCTKHRSELGVQAESIEKRRMSPTEASPQP